MDLARDILALVDAVLIAPYRWLDNPAAGWWLGTALLALWAVAVGEATLALVYRVNRRHVERISQKMRDEQRRAMNALKSGDKEAYKLLNREANDAFGKAFFLQIAMGAAGLWPAFLGAAWLQARFTGVPIPVPFTSFTLNYMPCFVILYLVFRVGWALVKKRLPWPAAGRGLGRELSHARRRRGELSSG